MSTFGPAYDRKSDAKRIARQMDRVRDVMLSAADCGTWLTLKELAYMTHFPEASISAQLRHLRKTRFGGFIINKRPRGERAKGLWEYQLEKPRPLGQQVMF